MAYDYKKPQSVEDPASKWNNEAQAYDGNPNDQVTCADSVAGPADLDPWVRFYNWQTKGFSVYSATFLYVNWKTNGSYSNDRFAIKYTKDGGSNWLDLVPLAIHNETSIKLSGAELDSDQDLTLVQVKLVYDRVGGPDTGITYIYDIWSRGSASYEDLTTYTETDPNSRITVTSARSSFAALTRNEDAYVYKDKGIDHFNGDYEHLVDVYFDAYVGEGGCAVWALANVIDDWAAIFNGTAIEHDVRMRQSGVLNLLQLDELKNSMWGITTDFGTISLDTAYYLELKRDENVGANGTLYCYIYTDAARTNLYDTLTVTLSAKDDFRYIYATQSWNAVNGTKTITGYSENFDLQEAAGWTGKLMGVTNPAKICGVAVANIAKVKGVA